MSRSRPRTGRTVAIVVGVLLIIVIASVAVFWRDIRVAWIVRGLRQDSTQLVQALEAASQGSEVYRRGVERYVQSEEGARVFLAAYLDMLWAADSDRMTSSGRSSQYKEGLRKAATVLFWNHHERLVVNLFRPGNDVSRQSFWQLNDEHREKAIVTATPLLQALQGREIHHAEWNAEIVAISDLPALVGRVYSGERSGDASWPAGTSPPRYHPVSEGFALLLTRLEPDSDAEQSE